VRGYFDKTCGKLIKLDQKFDEIGDQRDQNQIRLLVQAICCNRQYSASNVQLCDHLITEHYAVQGFSTVQVV